MPLPSLVWGGTTQMQEQEAPLSHVQHAPLDPHSEPVMPLADAQDDDPEEIFLRAVAEIDTQPLPPPQEICWPLVILALVFFFSFVGGSVIALVTYPTVTIEVVPVTRSATLTTPLVLPTRTLAPVSLSQSLTVATTGQGHQDARAATGILTFYNGLFTAQTIPRGTVFTGQDGVQVAIDAAVTIPAANPPQFAQASISAHALHAGIAGNIAAGAITTTVANGVLVKNSQLSGGQEARDFQAVAQADLAAVTAQVKATFAQEMPHAFTLAPAEAVLPTKCLFKLTANHRVGAEASALTVNATEDCTGLAYNREQLTQRATALFSAQTAPGAHYQLIGEAQVQIIRVAPLTVSCRGLWVYTLSQDEEQFLAEQIAGETPQQAMKYLLETGFLTRATVPGKLPRDPAHIHFQVFIGI
jgi:hypothetical protein